jgi:hypothetical protein
MNRYPDIAGFTDQQVCKAIAKETREIMEFWKNHSVGWAPDEASKILTCSMLDWQISLAEYLEYRQQTLPAYAPPVVQSP